MAKMKNCTDIGTQPLGYSINEACKVIPCSRSFLYRQIKCGRIRSTQHGRKVLISRQAILEFLGEATPATETTSVAS